MNAGAAGTTANLRRSDRGPLANYGHRLEGRPFRCSRAQNFVIGILSPITRLSISLAQSIVDQVAKSRRRQGGMTACIFSCIRSHSLTRAAAIRGETYWRRAGELLGERDVGVQALIVTFQSE